MTNNLLFDARELEELIKRISVSKGKDGGYSLFVSSKKRAGNYRVQFFCKSEISQGASAMEVEWRGTQEVNGRIEQYTEMEKNWDIHIAPVFREVVTLLAEGGGKIGLIYDGNTLLVQSMRSSVEVPLIKKPIFMENPKNAKKVSLTLKRYTLMNGLPYVNCVLNADSVFGNRYGMYPARVGETAVLHIFATDGYAVASDNYDVIGTSENFAEACEGLKYAMLPADKMNQIIANGKTDDVTMTFFYAEDNVTPKQVNIKCGNDYYQILPSMKDVYSRSIENILDSAYEEYDCSFQEDTKILQNACYVAALNNSEKTIIRVTASAITVGNDNEKQCSKLSGVVDLDKKLENGISFALSINKLMRILKPFSGKIKINCSDGNKKRLVTFESGECSVRLAMCPVTIENNVSDEEEHDEEEEIKDSNENEETKDSKVNESGDLKETK